MRDIVRKNLQGWQNERVASRIDEKGNRVITVLAKDAHHQKKVREVTNVMELELGLTPGWLLQRSCKVYLFISSSKKVVGCLLAEPIKSAFRVVPPEQGSPQSLDVRNMDSTEDRKQERNVMLFGNIKFSRETTPRKPASKERTQELGSAILCTTSPVPAVCGVRVIWVSHSQRRKGIASHLLDAMRYFLSHWMFCQKAVKSRIIVILNFQL
jgi:N-acetyltransferase